MPDTPPWSTKQDVSYLIDHLASQLIPQLEVFRKIVADTLAARSQHYANPSLAPWSGHGGDTINKKIQQLLKKLGSQIPGASQVFNEEMNRLSKKKGKSGKADSTRATPSPKKRKRAVKVESEEEDDDLDFDDY